MSIRLQTLHRRHHNREVDMQRTVQFCIRYSLCKHTDMGWIVFVCVCLYVEDTWTNTCTHIYIYIYIYI